MADGLWLMARRDEITANEKSSLGEPLAGGLRP